MTAVIFIGLEILVIAAAAVAVLLVYVRRSLPRRLDERRYSILESVQDGIYIVDDRWRFTHVNEKTEELLHVTAADLVGRRVDKILDPLASDLLPEMRQVRNSGIPVERTQFFPAGNMWIEIRIQPAMNEVLVYLRDVSDRKRAEIMLRDSERRLRLLLEQVPALVWTVDLDLRFTSFVGTEFSAKGFTREELGDERVEQIHRVFAGDSQRFESYHGGRWMQHHVEPLRGTSGQIIGAIGVALDITEMKETAEHLARLARLDALTQLPNRFALEEQMVELVERADVDGLRLAVLFIDLDRFKTINDTLGHRAGDELLRQFALRLRRAVDPNATVFRSGGDEFIVTLALGETVSVPMIAADIQLSMAEPFFIAERQLFVSASIGAATYPDDGSSAEELLSRADSAMYRAKYNGRSRIGFFDVGSDEQAPYRLRLEQDLHYAIPRGEFRLLYQPIVDAATAHIVGAEALLRWNHTKHGEIMPEEFIAIAEETGLIVPISRWVLREACAEAARIRASGHPQFRIAVNLSARDFGEVDLADTIRDILAETGLPPDALEIEITENMKIDDVALMTMRTLNALGVRIVVDDFGVAYSALGYLKRLPIGALKIDRTFIRDAGDDPHDRAIVRAIVALARSLDLEIIAEGVESAEQLKFVTELNCERVQGFHFSRPVEARELLGVPGYSGTGRSA
ncbi:MAG TPA: EAL domain-containing protein [Candidatus Acidoferrales bacterium]|nr:EAL domain-containing protein [Candidatus Acidoferrales bacterium]